MSRCSTTALQFRDCPVFYMAQKFLRATFNQYAHHESNDEFPSHPPKFVIHNSSFVILMRAAPIISTANINGNWYANINDSIH